MLTKKHFIAVAKILRDRDLATENLTQACVVMDIREDLADYFASDNPNFDRSRFIDAATAVQGERE